MSPDSELEERLRIHARPHGAALVRPLGGAVLGAAVGGACIWLGADVHWLLGAIGALVVALSALVALATVWEWDRTDVRLTSSELTVAWGLIRRRVAEVRLDHDHPISLEQGLAGRVLGYGTLVAGEFEVPYVPCDRRDHLPR